jgi:murein DD-endopeptidase MepM/ murein hydrolase activator NlpD
MRLPAEPIRSRSRSRLALALAIPFFAAACSSESSRFGEGAFSNPFRSSNASETSGSAPAQRPAAVAQVESRPLPQATYQEPYQPQPQSAYQPNSVPPPSSTGSVRAPQQTAQQAPVPRQAPQNNSSNWQWEGGTAVTVAPGETIASLSSRYGVPASAIAQSNGLAANAPVYPGQRVVIPRYNYAASSAPAPAAAPNTPPPAARPAVNTASHRNTPVPATPTRVAASPPAPALQPQPQPQVQQPRYASVEPAPTARMVTPAAEKPPVEETNSADGNAGAAGFRWPARGRIIAGFGPKPTGQQNDGINLALPEGTPVKAADDGVVAYSGNELKGYGNLVLIRHANGFVTAYAHASEVMVKRGDTIKRGQVIAKSGQTGNVTSPQLHFEIRKGASPVDPMQHLPGA